VGRDVNLRKIGLACSGFPGIRISARWGSRIELAMPNPLEPHFLPCALSAFSLPINGKIVGDKRNRLAVSGVYKD